MCLNKRVKIRLAGKFPEKAVLPPIRAVFRVIAARSSAPYNVVPITEENIRHVDSHPARLSAADF